MNQLPASRKELESVLRNALAAKLNSVPGYGHTYPRLRDVKNEVQWKKLIEYTLPDSKKTKRASFINLAGFSDNSTPGVCNDFTIRYSIYLYHEFSDAANSAEDFTGAIMDAADALADDLDLGFTNVEHSLLQMPDESELDPQDLGFGVFAHSTVLTLEIRILR